MTARHYTAADLAPLFLATDLALEVIAAIEAGPEADRLLAQCYAAALRAVDAAASMRRLLARDRLVLVLADATPAEARAVWDALAAFCENEEADGTEDGLPDPHYPPARALCDRLGTAMASYAEATNPTEEIEP